MARRRKKPASTSAKAKAGKAGKTGGTVRRRPKASRKAAARPKAKAKASAGATGTASPRVAFQKTSVTIRFDNEQELRSRLRDLVALVEPPRQRTGMALAAAAAAEPALTLFQAIEVVSEALDPHKLDPPEKLGETYLTSQERELFQARVVNEVGDRRCRIDAADVPAEEATTHGSVITAVREKARRQV